MALECASDFYIATKFAFFVIHLGWQVLFLALWVQILWWRLAVKTSDFPPTSNWQQGRLFCVSQKWRTLAGKGVLIGWWIGKDGKPWNWNGKFVEWESIDGQQGRFWLRFPQRKWAHLVNPTIGNPLPAKTSTWGVQKKEYRIYVIDHKAIKTGFLLYF